MVYNVIRKFKKEFGYNKPILKEEIYDCMNDFSRQIIFQLIEEAIGNGTLIRYDTGIYYLPTKTEFGTSIILVNEIVNKKYVSDKNKVFVICDYKISGQI